MRIGPETFTIQDSIVLNLLRACEAAIDLAMSETYLAELPGWTGNGCD